MKREHAAPGTHTTVEARFDEHGGVTPLAFHWRGRRMPVAACGRTWVTGEGEARESHYLVMSAGEEVFELVLEHNTLQWRVASQRAAQALT